MSTVSLSQVQLQMIQIGLPIFIIIGNLDCILGLFVFLQKSMRNNPCIILLIGYMMTNLFYINFTVLSTLLTGYGIDFSTRSIVFCRIRMYFSFVFTAIPSYLLVMASMDRMFVSSSNVEIRLRSNKRFALLMIIVISLFWILFHLHAVFFSEIQLIYGVKLSCTTRSGGPSTFVSYYALINAIIPITLMSIFGIQTLLHIKRARRRVVNSRDRRLIAMLIAQLSIYIFLRLPTSVYLVYGETTKSNVKNSNETAIQLFVHFITIFCQFIQVCISPLMNLITNSFRIELKRAFNRMNGEVRRRGELGAFLSQRRNINKIQMQEMTPRFNNTIFVKPRQQQEENQQI